MQDTTNNLALLGDEAVALGLIHGGISAAYGYPGTPSTEILEYLIDKSGSAGCNAEGGYVAQWCSNEKTALEAALGVSFAGRRAAVTMKHVGLNVASDPFMNGALLGIKGGLVIAVADDPGMHSSQNEQDSRFYAAFAMVPCLEPRSQQEAYDMAYGAFSLSEEFRTPVIIRMTTRLSHARSAVTPKPALGQNAAAKSANRQEWMLLPAYARKNYLTLIEKQEKMIAWSAAYPVNKLETAGRNPALAVITSGLGGNYFEENLDDFTDSLPGKKAPARLHIGAYPLPVPLIRELCEKAEKLIVVEEGQPFIEEKLRGILPQKIKIVGRLANGQGEPGMLPRTGELYPDNIRPALGLGPRQNILDSSSPGDFAALRENLPGRPPQLCAGCPHGDSYNAIKKAVALLDPSPGSPKTAVCEAQTTDTVPVHPNVAVCADIGCYSLGASPPYEVPESIVCMGASIGMARGAAEAGIPYAFAVIGDSTFLHSGIPGLVDAAASSSPLTIVILDNSIVAMTGCQPTMIPSSKLKPLILGCGADPAHVLELETKPQNVDANAAALAEEARYRGLSVVILRRECLEAFRKRNKKGS